MAPTGDKGSSHGVMGMFGLTPETADKPQSNSVPGTGSNSGPDPILVQVLDPGTSGQQPTTSESPLTAEQQALADLALVQGPAAEQAQQPAPVGGVEDLNALLESEQPANGEPLTLPSDTTVQNRNIPLPNGLTGHEYTITIPGQEPFVSSAGVKQGISDDQLAGLFTLDEYYTSEQRDHDLALVAGRPTGLIGPVSPQAVIDAQNRLDSHWRPGGLWLADGSTVLPDAVYSAGEVAADLALASTEGALDTRSEQLRQQARERLLTHRYSLAAQAADQIDARYANMDPGSAEYQAKIAGLIKSGVLGIHAEEVLRQNSLAASARLEMAGVPVDRSVGDMLATQSFASSSGASTPPALILAASDGNPLTPSTVDQATAPGDSGAAHALVPAEAVWALMLPGLLAPGSTLSPEAAAAVLGTSATAGAGAGTAGTGATTATVGGLTAAAALGTVMSLVVSTGGVPLLPSSTTPAIGKNDYPEPAPDSIPWATPGMNPWTHEGTGPTVPQSIPGVDATNPSIANPNPNNGTPSSPSVRPTPADDPNTVSQPVRFPSTKPGQPDVPIEGTFWDGNGILRNGRGNPRGEQPGSYPRTGNEVNLKADLFELDTWSLDDIDEAKRPPVIAAMAVVHGAELYRGMHYAWVETLANVLGVDVAKLTGSRSVGEAALDDLRERGMPAHLLESAVDAWWDAKAPVDRAKELLGEAGAIAMLESDGWTVNTRPRGGYRHDIVAVKDGQVMVIEAKGGNPGKPRPGDAEVPDGPDSPTTIRAEQMTDPYLWGKLKEDAQADPAFMEWLIAQGVWEAIQNEDPSLVGYRLTKTDTEGKITVYGSTQEPINSGIPSHTIVGKTTGNRPGTPAIGSSPGPTLHGVAQSIAPFGHPGSWLSGLVQGQRDHLSALAHSAARIRPVPALQPGQWPRKETADQSLTVTVTTPVKCLAHTISRAEQFQCLTYL